MDALFQDLRFAVRTLRRAPGFALAAVATLALGIGANTALFGVVRSVLLRPLPFERPERLVTPSESFLRAEYARIRDGARSFDGFAGYQGAQFSLAGGGDPVRLDGAYASGNLFTTLGVAPLLGRALVPADERPGAEAVAVLGHALWRERFGGDAGVVGRRVLLDGRPTTVVGVMPPSFLFPSGGTRVWVPLEMDPARPGTFWGIGGLQAVGRLREGVSPAQAQAELRAFGPALRQANPLWTPDEGYRAQIEAVPLQSQVVGGVRTMLWVLQGAMAGVLLIACANLASVTLARGLAREREVAVRAALGAGRGRVVRLFLAESLVLAPAGGAAGVLVAVWGVRGLVRLLPPETPRLAEVAVDGGVLAFAAAATALAGVAFGAAPALHASRGSIEASLRGGGRAGAAGGPRRAAGALAAAEVALAVVLVSGAGLLVRSFWSLSRVDPGFRSEQRVAARVSPPERMYGDADRQRAFHQAVLERAAALPGVGGVAAASQLPFDGETSKWATAVEGVHTDPRATLPMFDRRAVTPDFFRVMGVPLLRGRAFTAADRPGSPDVVVVDEEAARRFWPGQDPVGKRIGQPWTRRWLTVVGVVGSVRNNTLAGPVEPAMYVPFAQSPAAQMTLVVRTAADPEAVAGELRALVRAVDPAVPVSGVRAVGEMVSGSVAAPRLTALLLGALAALALLLGAVGIYGVVAYGVGRRRREIGVRMALGAQRAQVVAMVVRQGALLAAAGLLLGIPAALAAARLLRGMLFGVGPADPLTFAAVPVLLAATALAASWLPARRAARVDPMVALRSE